MKNSKYHYKIEDKKYKGLHWFSRIYKGEKEGIILPIETIGADRDVLEKILEIENKHAENKKRRKSGYININQAAGLYGTNKEIFCYIPFHEIINSDVAKEELGLVSLAYYNENYQTASTQRYKAYFNEIVPPPNNLDIDFICESGRLKISFQGMRKNNFEKFKYIIPINQSIEDFLIEKYKYIEKNISKVDDDYKEKFIISPVAQNVINNIDKFSQNAVNLWLDNIEKLKELNLKDKIQELKIPSMNKFTLQFSRIVFGYDDHNNQIKLTLNNNDFKYEEKGKGAHITVKQNLADTIVSSYVGERLDKVINLPGAEDILISNSKNNKESREFTLTLKFPLSNINKTEYNHIDDDNIEQSINMHIKENKYKFSLSTAFVFQMIDKKILLMILRQLSKYSEYRSYTFNSNLGNYFLTVSYDGPNQKTIHMHDIPSIEFNSYNDMINMDKNNYKIK